jgi:hypothetical protein
MIHHDMPKEEVVARGKQIYNEKLRASLERDHMGQFAVVDVLSGDYEVGEDDAAASFKMLERRPDALLYGIRVGQETAYRFGGPRIVRPS